MPTSLEPSGNCRSCTWLALQDIGRLSAGHRRFDPVHEMVVYMDDPVHGVMTTQV